MECKTSCLPCLSSSNQTFLKDNQVTRKPLDGGEHSLLNLNTHQ